MYVGQKFRTLYTVGFSPKFGGGGGVGSGKKARTGGSMIFLRGENDDRFSSGSISTKS
jgi:hypothetical protein